jgi:hypothetical protein
MAGFQEKDRYVGGGKKINQGIILSLVIVVTSGTSYQFRE